MKHEEMDQYLAETDLQIDRLHALYEQWFMGLEKRPPTKAREVLEKRLALMRTNLPRNTAHRFRAQTILQRWVTMTHHWNKVTRQIEEGTYYRDVAKAKRRAAERDQLEARKSQKAAASKKAQDDVALRALDGWRLDDQDLDSAFDSLFDDGGSSSGPDPFADEAPAAVVARPLPSPAATSPAVPPPALPGSSASLPRPVAPPPRVDASSAAMPRPMPPPPVASSGGAPRPVAPPPVASSASSPRPDVPQVFSTVTAPRPEAARAAELDYQSVYRKYVAAKQQNNERVDNVKLESIVATIEKQLPELRKKHGGKSIDFEVVVRDGRVGLKPVAR